MDTYNLLLDETIELSLCQPERARFQRYRNSAMSMSTSEYISSHNNEKRRRLYRTRRSNVMKSFMICRLILFSLCCGSLFQNHYDNNKNRCYSVCYAQRRQQQQQELVWYQEKFNSKQEQNQQRLQQTRHDWNQSNANNNTARILLFGNNNNKKKNMNKNSPQKKTPPKQKKSPEKQEKVLRNAGATPIKASFSTENLPDAIKRKKNTNHNKVPQLAVVHIGPHKTSTTSIQGFAKEFMDELRKDGYAIPGDWSQRNTINMIELTNCFLPKFSTTREEDVRRHHRSLKFSSTYCDKQILDDIPKIASLGYNIFLTAESFSYLAINLDEVKEVLRPWQHVKVIAYYRRFYDWLHSQWNQDHKDLHPSIRPTFNDYLTKVQPLGKEEVMGFQKAYNNNYITACIPRWKKLYDDVVVYNMHDMKQKKATVTFYCDSLPNATNTCFALEARLRTKREDHINPSHKYVYTDLAYVAGKDRLNLIPPSSKYYNMPIPQLGKVIQEYHEMVMSKSSYDFPGDTMICPDETILSELLQKTLDTERDYFPEYYEKMGQHEIKEQFEIDKETKLCHVNATAVLLRDPTWQTYFKSLS